MQRLLALVVTAAIAVALYAATAGGTQQAVTPGQFNALKKEVTKLQKDVNGLKGLVSNCLVPIGITQFGDTTSAGYHYKQPDGTEILTTALDGTPQGVQPDALMLTFDPKCLTGSSLHLTRLHGSGARRSASGP